MPLNESPSVSVSRRGHSYPGSDLLRTVVWVGGEHDCASRLHLSVTIAQAALVDDADVVVDLSGVAFMDASTIGALVGARNRLRASSRSLTVRAPSPAARRVLELCGLTQLIDGPPAPARPAVAPALGSWVGVPAWDRSPDAEEAPVAREAPSQEPVRVLARRRVEPAGSSRQRRATS